MKSEPNRKANIWTARVIPVLLLALIVYSSWVVTKILCIDYLLNPSLFLLVHPRRGPAIAIITLYYLLLLPVIISYGRLILTILTNPGYVERGRQWHTKEAQKLADVEQRHRHSRGHKDVHEKGRTHARSSRSESRTREDDFWCKDMFICNYDGRPPFCSSCLNYKVDRVHHCSEVNRCVRKMDHFCPWVGGIISETSFKFFLQLTFYTAWYTLFTLAVLAYYFAERRHQDPGFLDVHWVLCLGFAGLFLLFGLGMFASSFQLTLINCTTVENLSRHTKIHYVAVYLARPEETIRRNDEAGKSEVRTVTYPRPPEEQLQILEQHSSPTSTSAPGPPARMSSIGQQQTPSAFPIGTIGAPNSRTFAILETTRGTNPWDLGLFENVRQVLGNNVIDWFLPIKRSPCATYKSDISFYEMNPELLDLRQVLDIENDESRPKKRRRRRRRRRRRDSQGHSGDTSDERSRRSRSLSRPHVEPGECPPTRS